MQKYFLSGGTNADTIVSVSVCGYPADAFVDAMAGLGFCFWCSIRGMQAAGCKQASLGKQASRTFASKPQTRCRLSPSLCLFVYIEKDRELQALVEPLIIICFVFALASINCEEHALPNNTMQKVLLQVIVELTLEWRHGRFQGIKIQKKGTKKMLMVQLDS